MADKDPGDGASLELPKLFGRKKDKRRRGDDSEPAAEPSEAPEAPEPEVEVEAEPEVVEPQAVEPQAVEPTEVTAPLPGPAPSAPEPAAEPALPEYEPVATPAPEPVAPPGPAGHDPEPAAVPTSTRVDTRSEPDPSVEETGMRRMPSAPALPTAVAAVLVGALVAVLGIGLTWLGLLGCEAVRGTQSCGGPGLLVLLAIMVVMIVSGSALLKALGVPQSGSLSSLGFGILAVVVLTFLLEHLYEPWVLVLLPVISAAGYGIAHWVTTRFTEPDPDLRR